LKLGTNFVSLGAVSRSYNLFNFLPSAITMRAMRTSEVGAALAPFSIMKDTQLWFMRFMCTN